ncbi:MAG: hypothetical protein IPO90_09435 [Flavobacteriales bacterium]|nr:hypothetical protein [Flavobacteriales bacterium]
MAGNDVLLFPQNPIKAIDRIHQAVDSGTVPREMMRPQMPEIAPERKNGLAFPALFR